MNPPSSSNLPEQPKPAPGSVISDAKEFMLFLWNFLWSFAKGLLGLGLALLGLFFTLFSFFALNQVSFLGPTFVDLFLKWLGFGLLPLWGGVRLLKGALAWVNGTTAISNGKKRGWRPNLVTVLLALFILGPAITSLIQSANFRDPFRKDHLLVAEASQLGATEITPVLAAPIRPGTNLLWCGSFQLAWNAACSLVDEDLHFIQEPPLVAALNQKPFTRADLDEASYVALAGFTQKGIHRQIEQAVRDKFQDRVQPRFIPDPM